MTTPPLYARYLDPNPAHGFPGAWLTNSVPFDGAQRYELAHKAESETKMKYTACKNCGYDEGLHHYQTMQCPVGGEAPIGRKQEWMTRTYQAPDENEETIERLLREKASLTAANATQAQRIKELENALMPFAKMSERYNDCNDATTIIIDDDGKKLYTVGDLRTARNLLEAIK